MPNEFMEMINCTTAAQVFEQVKQWSSDLTDRQHLVRSTILDIHADIERLLKQILYRHQRVLVFGSEDTAEYEEHKKALEKSITGLNFATVLRILRPALDAFPSPDLQNISGINELRNNVTHAGGLGAILYKNRSPFEDPDCLAQVFLEGWAIRKELRHFTRGW
jgi:hypothetical protein